MQAECEQWKISAGVWEVENVLDAGYDANAAEFRPQIVSIEVQDVPGVLNQVTGMSAATRPPGCLFGQDCPLSCLTLSLHMIL